MTILKLGSRGEAVRQVQKALHLLPDGIYGYETERAVRQFQMDHRLTVDGMVGPATLAKLLPSRLKRSRRMIKEIIVHCTATPEGKDYTVNDIRRWHREKGWSDIGYHYVVYRNGQIATGRDVDLQGAHCAEGGHNRYSIGVCYVGGMTRDGRSPKDTRTPQQRSALLSLLTDLKMLYPEAKIYGHRDFAHKDCPCFDAKREYSTL
jgi:N-acetylmuramoyl-L-alanine amidase